MMAGPSTLSLVAAALYLLVAACAAGAGVIAVRERQSGWHRLVWVLVALLFMGLALVRFYGVEEMLRGEMRMLLYAERSYEERRAFQKPLIALVFAVGATMVAGLLYVLASRIRGRRNVAAVVALACAGGLLFLLALRLVSLHSVDALLYGPLKINWFADLGMSFGALACALRYVLIVRVTRP